MVPETSSPELARDTDRSATYRLLHCGELALEKPDAGEAGQVRISDANPELLEEDDMDDGDDMDGGDDMGEDAAS